MAKISKERLQKYRDLANIPSIDSMEPAARAIFQRMRDEGAEPMTMRNPSTGMYMAPFRNQLKTWTLSV